MPAFSQLAREFIDEWFALDPVFATHVGFHDHDGNWPAMDPAGVAERIRWCDRWTATLCDLPAAALGSAEQIDRDRLRLLLDEWRYAEAELREADWNPLVWIWLTGEGLFPLIARDFAPLATRLGFVADRAEGIPALLETAVARLGTDATTPVPRLHVERALVDLPGVGALLGEALELAAGRADAPEVAAVLPRLRAAVATATAPLDRFETHLRETLLPPATGDGRLGPQRFAEKLAHTVADPALTPDRILAEAERAYGLVRAEMIRIARTSWPELGDGGPPPDDDAEVVRRALDRVAADHPDPDGLLDTCRDALGRIEAFCRERSVIGLADEPLRIQWTPRFLRSWATAMLHSPGPFDVGQPAFFSVTPPDETWSPEQVASYLREANRGYLTVLTIHEAVPGHYLQGVYANRAPSLVRSVFGDGLYAEGWAVYVTQVMIDRGFADGDPALLLAHWKYYLRAAINAILDVRVHCHGMTEAEAIALMVDGGWQEQAEAVGKFRRARLTATQLCTYFLGSQGFWAIERAARIRAAAASGDLRGAAAVPAPAIVGGYGETPGFDARAHLESVIGTGSLPLPLLRRAILEED